LNQFNGIIDSAKGEGQSPRKAEIRQRKGRRFQGEKECVCCISIG